MGIEQINLPEIRKGVQKELQRTHQEAILHPYTTLAITALSVIGTLFSLNLVSLGIAAGFVSYMLVNAEKFQRALEEFKSLDEWSCNESTRQVRMGKIFVLATVDRVQQTVSGLWSSLRGE
ncbi:MAG: hypothetical protein JW769_05340 [Parachlamydiales bacterium]|nr:hypothetical protein [Parachlamydiales bacterium]